MVATARFLCSGAVPNAIRGPDPRRICWSPRVRAFDVTQISSDRILRPTTRMRSTTLASALLFVVTASASPAQEKADAVVEPSLKSPRGKLLEWKSAQAKTYWYRLPKDIEPKNPPDLLIMLHGTGLNHGWSFWNYPVIGDFRRRDIVISPDGLTPGQGDTFNFVQGPKDGEQIAGLITDFKKRFPIGRVYLYGHSQGAFF